MQRKRAGVRSQLLRVIVVESIQANNSNPVSGAKGIANRISPRDSPSHNGLGKRGNRMLIESA